jgi:hypothetical protein
MLFNDAASILDVSHFSVSFYAELMTSTAAMVFSTAFLTVPTNCTGIRTARAKIAKDFKGAGKTYYSCNWYLQNRNLVA